MRISAETDEEFVRARDRMRVQHARRRGDSFAVFLLLIGPGVLTMLGENDGPSMISYSATGAAYGVGFFLPFILLTFAMAYVVQETAMRVGIATGRGHAEIIRDRFGDRIASLALIDLAAGNVLTLVGEFVAIATGAAFLGIPASLAVPGALALVLGAFATQRYFTWERFALALALCNLVFIPVAVRAHPHPAALLHALGSWQPVPHLDAAFLTLVLANLGATVTPWMIFFQQSAVIDKGLTPRDVRFARIDTAIGTVLAACVAVAALCIGSVLYGETTPDAYFASALLPHLGKHASTLFALGMVEAGSIAAVTISVSSGYAVGGAFGAGKSLNRPFADGALFYGVIVCSLLLAAGIVLIPGAPLLQLAIFANVAATVLMAPVLVLLLRVSRDRTIMGALTNSRAGTLACGAIVAVVALLSIAYGIVALVQRS
ncbi:MAG TPA: divalent metal cation transporter [Candidatus Baltobacteraceae bacterium]|nr:divalent metal cation transporter [Candidatus Baltobacteraceae bacterium]